MNLPEKLGPINANYSIALASISFMRRWPGIFRVNYTINYRNLQLPPINDKLYSILRPRQNRRNFAEDKQMSTGTLVQCINMFTVEIKYIRNILEQFAQYVML